MDTKTRTALHDLNRRFYDRNARQFSGTRQRPWLGWKRVVEHLGAPRGDNFRVLDIGCGNGRFGAYLADGWTPSFRYLGCDACDELLRIAAEQLKILRPTPELLRQDILAGSLATLAPGRSFDLIVSFGVMHHVPGTKARQDHLKQLADLLAPGGLLAVSVWRFDRNPRFASRVIPWRSYLSVRETQGLPPIEAQRLEANDVLLGWSGDLEHPRYCHFPYSREIEGWIETLEPPLVDRFEADGSTGKDNTYLLFRAALAATELC